MRETSNRSLTLGYIIALAIIAAMSLSSHLALTRVLKEHERSAAVINVSGRQRMLSQRIAGSAAELALGLPEARTTLEDALDQFERANHDLIAGNPALGLPPAGPAVRALSFEGPAPLDVAVGAFIAQGRRLLAIPAEGLRGSPDLAALLAAAHGPLLGRLDAVVSLNQGISESQLALFRRLEDGSLAVVLLTLLGEALLIFRPMTVRIARYTKALMTIATTDHLTQILNRRSLFERATARLARSRIDGRPLSVLLIDVDRFKAVNDTYGHAAGDAVLRSLSKGLEAALHPGDILGRLGGEEFCVVLPDAALADALGTAERLRAAAESLSVIVEGVSIPVTISIGVAEAGPADAAFQSALDRADRGVYRAKAAGRNRVVSVPAETMQPGAPPEALAAAA